MRQEHHQGVLSPGKLSRNRAQPCGDEGKCGGTISAEDTHNGLPNASCNAWLTAVAMQLRGGGRWFSMLQEIGLSKACVPNVESVH